MSAIPPPGGLKLPTVQSEAGPAGNDAQRWLSLAREGGGDTGESNEAGAVT